MSVNFTTFFLGVVFLVGTVISSVWMLSLRGILRKQIFLQRSLFLFITLAYFTRTLQHLVLNQICPGKGKGISDEPICEVWLTHLNQFFDLLAQSFNFIVYLILSCFWAEQVSSMRTMAVSGFDSSSEKSRFNRVRRRVNIFFWTVLAIVFSLLALFMTALLAFQAKWSSQLWLTGRLIFRVMLSLAITALLAVFGYQMLHGFRRYFSAKSGLGRIAIITVLCGLAYVSLSFANVTMYLIDSLFSGAYSKWAHNWIFVNLLGMIEWSSHAVLLFLLTPKLLQQALDKCCCFVCHTIERKRHAARGRATSLADIAFATLDEEYTFDKNGEAVNFYSTPSISIKNLRTSLMYGEDLPGGQFSTSFGQNSYDGVDDEYDEHLNMYSGSR